LLGPWQSHAEFRWWLEKRLEELFQHYEPLVRFHAGILEKVYVLDLDPLQELMTFSYSCMGRPAVKQAQIFRALVVMNHYKQGISAFVFRLKSDPVLAAACGFEPDSVPGVGTFYDFLDRLWLEAAPGKVLREPLKKGKKSKSKEKLPESDPNIVARLVEQVMAGYFFEDKPERLLQKILAECAVKPSAKLGLLGNTQNLVVAGDGAPLETGASPYGRKVCSCKTLGIYRCSCPRYYSDPTANWGWDSYHERWFYGHTLYQLTAANSFNDLPLLINLPQGSRHDSVTSVRAFAQLVSLYPEFKFVAGLFDSAHDAYDIYKLLGVYEIEPFIDLNKRNETNHTYPKAKIDEKGIPVCPANLNMLNWGFENKRQRNKWRCPLYKSPEDCTYREQCSPSAYARVVYTKPADDPRLFTKTPRGSKSWKKAYARRTSVERSLKRTLVDYLLESLRLRADKRWVAFATLCALNQHMDAQVAASKSTLFHKLGLKAA